MRMLKYIAAAVALVILPIKVSAEETTPSYVLMEMTTGTVISESGADESVPVGTMCKLMTVLLSAEEIDSGRIKTEDTVKVSAAANAMQGAQIWLMPGEEITVDELMKGVIIGNANDASVALAETVCGTEEKFVARMNSRAAELGMVNTKYTNCCGYYDEDKQVSSARDMGILCCELYKYDFLRGYFTTRLDYIRGGATQILSSNKLTEKYGGLCGFKAGFGEVSGRCAAVAAERDGEAYAAVLLGYDDEDEMFTLAKRLLNTGFDSYCVFRPQLPEDIPSEIEVKGGIGKTVPVDYGYVRSVVVSNGGAKSITSRAILPDCVYAPVKKGDKLGEVHFYMDDRFIFSSDILAADNAEQLTPIKMFGILLKKLISFS